MTAPAKPDALGVECPFCRTPALWQCRDARWDNNGNIVDVVRRKPHAARLRAARAAAGADEGEGRG